MEQFYLNGILKTKKLVMSNLKFVFLIIILKFALICLGQKGNTQQTKNDYLVSIINNQVDSILESDFTLKNGRVYTYKFTRAKGHPFFGTKKWSDGRLILKKNVYYNIPLMFDLDINGPICLIKTENNEEHIIIPNKYNVKSFNIDQHCFLNCCSLPFLPQDGFYEVVHDGKNLKVYIKWSKQYENHSVGKYSGYFNKQRPTFYVLLKGKVYKIKSEKNLYELFNHQKKTIKSFIKKHKIKLNSSEQVDVKEFFKYLETQI